MHRFMENTILDVYSELFNPAGSAADPDDGKDHVYQGQYRRV